jgi:signal transduction histidine kinase
MLALGLTEMATKKPVSRKKRALYARALPREQKLVKSKAKPKKSTRKPAQKKAVTSVGAVERVVAELAHDIRTPLTGIIALSELLAGSTLGERERRWVAALRSSADHLALLTTLVVDAARMNVRDLPLRHEPFDLRALADVVAVSLATRAQGAGLQCHIDVAADLPRMAVGDVVRLRAALENLVDNAVKFTLRGNVGLKLTADKHARGWRLTFAISDSGIGLTPAEIKRLFKPFSQAHDGIARRFGGSGLGLSLVKRLARAMGGDLDVSSAPGRGSTFRLTVVVGGRAK